MAEIGWRYIAGFFDGEGNINTAVGRGSFQVAIDFAQSGYEGECVLASIRDFLLARGIHAWIRPMKHKRARRQMYKLRVSSNGGSTRCLKGMLPFLTVKRAKAQDVLRYRILWPSLTAGSARKESLRTAKALLQKERRHA